jgi:hypothetical protein
VLLRSGVDRGQVVLAVEHWYSEPKRLEQLDAYDKWLDEVRTVLSGE